MSVKIIVILLASCHLISTRASGALYQQNPLKKTVVNVVLVIHIAQKAFS